MFIVPHIQFGLPCHAVLCALTFEDFRTFSIFICANSRSCNKQVSFWGSSSPPPTRTPWVPQSHWHQQCLAACSCPQCRTRRTSDNPTVFFKGVGVTMASKTFSFWVILDALFPVCMVCLVRRCAHPGRLHKQTLGKS